jgi:hypothetical protein
LSLDRESRLPCGLHRLPNDLIELGGEGAEDTCHHDVVQFSLIDGWICDVGDDVVVDGVAMKREKYEVTPPYVVG